MKYARSLSLLLLPLRAFVASFVGFAFMVAVFTPASRARADSPAAELSQTQDQVPKSLRIMLEELAYMGTDYPAAIQGGKIIDQKEYAEMLEFAESARKQFALVKEPLTLAQERDLELRLQALQAAIVKKEDPGKILELTQGLVDDLTVLFEVPVAPQQAPHWELGRRVYQQDCSGCHGQRGRGDGPLAAGLNPPPRSFFDEQVMRQSPPFKFYNILLTGIAGTAMAAYKPQLSEEELWSVSFYLAGLRYESYEPAVAEAGTPEALPASHPEKYWAQLPAQEQQELLAAGLTKAFLANQTDADLLEWREAHWLQPSTSATQWLAALRLGASFVAAVPLTQDAEGAKRAEVLHDKIIANLAFTQQKVTEASLKVGQAAGGLQTALLAAEQCLLEAYLLGFEKTEITLALIDKSAVASIERLFLDARGYARKAALAPFTESLAALTQELENIKQQYTASLTQRQTNSSWGEFLAAFVIIVREGIEAFLVIAALLAILSSLGEVRARKWVHAGWLAAIACGALTYYIFESVLQLSGAAKESVEALCTGVAVILLFYTGFWLLSQVEQKKWSRFVKEKSQQALNSGKLWGLFTIAFIAVYREAAETVLFYAALLNTAKNPSVISMGFVSGCLMLVAVCWGIIRFNLRLPLRQFFIITSCLMVGISIVLAGKTIRELVEAGHLHATPLGNFPSVEFLGIYPSVETLAAQLFLLGLGLAIAYYVLVWKKKLHRENLES